MGRCRWNKILHFGELVWKTFIMSQILKTQSEPVMKMSLSQPTNGPFNPGPWSALSVALQVGPHLCICVILCWKNQSLTSHQKGIFGQLLRKHSASYWVPEATIHLEGDKVDHPRNCQDRIQKSILWPLTLASLLETTPLHWWRGQATRGFLSEVLLSTLHPACQPAQARKTHTKGPCTLIN